MHRLISYLVAASLLTTAAVAHAELMVSSAFPPVSAPVVADTVVSIGATTTMNEHEAIIAAPGRGKIVATANADVFCAGEETARSLILDVETEGPTDITVDFCQAHLERRDVMIRFVAAD